MNKRVLELDCLRGLAALAVLVYHFTDLFARASDSAHTPPFDFFHGHYGVQLFFMISGFVIYMTLQKVERPMDFVVSRASRLFPTYWVSVLLTAAAVHFFPLPERLFHPATQIMTAGKVLAI